MRQNLYHKEAVERGGVRAGRARQRVLTALYWSCTGLAALQVGPSAGTTNSYVLSLLTANTHQDRYFTTDLPRCMAGLELGVFQVRSEHFCWANL